MEPPETPPQQPPADTPQPPAPQPYAPPPVMEQPPAPGQAYAPPPYGQMPVAPAAKRGRGPIIAIVLIVALVLLGGGGYLVGGFVYGQGKLDTARTTYNAVIERENKLTDLFNSLTQQINTVDPSNATKASVAQAKTLYGQLVTQSQAAQSTIASDQADLASSDTKLRENSWLSVLAGSSIDNQVTKNDYLASAVGVAKTITTDYVEYGNFNVAMMSALDDLLTIGDASDAHDLAGATAASAKLKSDVDLGITLDHAPGLVTQVDLFMHDLQAVATDFVALFAAAAAGDGPALTQAENALNRDAPKLDGYDFNNWDTQANNFYGDLIDQHNSFIDKANKVTV